MSAGSDRLSWEETMKTFPYLAAACLALSLTPAFANEFEAPLKALAGEEIAAIAALPAVVEAIKAQNAETASFDAAKIDALDKAWRAEVGAGDQPTIKAVMSRPASADLVAAREKSSGLFTEIFVMDAKGLNVAQSDVTSDYWQGDEAKWQDTFAKGAGAIHISDVEEDESTQTFQSQVSMTVVDPADGQPIGAITVGVNVELLQ